MDLHPTVRTLVTTFAGVTIEEDEKHRDGVDEETDERLRLRNSLKWALLTRFGLIDEAVVALALEANPAVHRVAVRSDNPNGPGTFQVIVTGIDAPVGAGVLVDVEAAVKPYLMDPSLVEVKNADTVDLNITGQVFVSANFEWTEVVRPAIMAALEEWRRTIPLGGFSYPVANRVPLNEVEHVIRSVRIGNAQPVRTVQIAQLSPPNDNLEVPAFAHIIEGNWWLEPLPVSDS